ncbi:MAG: helix-turn-helix domain-containing protein [Thermodesulfobacteriota bacterium]
MDELNIARKIRQIRLQNNLTLEKVAKLTGFTKSYLSMLESGKKSPPIATLSKIANALEVDIPAFFEQKKPEDQIILVRKGEGKALVRDGNIFGTAMNPLPPRRDIRRWNRSSSPIFSKPKSSVGSTTKGKSSFMF